MRLRLVLLSAVVAAFAAANGAAAPAKPPQLVAWAVGWRKPVVGVSRVGYGGPLVERLAPGRYRVEADWEGNMSFHLYGAGVDRMTGYSAELRPHFVSWTVTFRRGVYRYRAEGIDAVQLAQRGVPTKGSFTVR